VTDADPNRDSIDSQACDVRCACGWLKRFMGLEALRHFVVSWDDSPDIKHLPDQSVDDGGLADA
jgi:hypothetical protein